MFKLFGKHFPGWKDPILLVQLIYLISAIALTHVYFHKIISPCDFNTDEYGSIFKVLNLEAVSTIQFRFLVPLLVSLFTLVIDLPPKAVMFFLTVIFIYLTLLAYYRILCLYFKNSLFNSLLAILIIYPLSWNLIAVNNIFFFTDTSSLFFMTLSLYFVLTRNFKMLLPVFLLGTVNHYSIGFIIPAFLLFNYKNIFKARIVLNTSILTLLFTGYFLITRMLLPERPPEKDDGYMIINFQRVLFLISGMKVHLLLRDIIFNFGGIHLFALLFYFSPVWKKMNRSYTVYNLTILIFILLTLTGFGLHSEELRCYVPVLPFLMIPAMLFFSQFSGGLMRIKDNILAEKHDNEKLILHPR